MDEAIESGKMKSSKTKYHIVAPLSIQELIDEIIKDGNLNNMFVYYENMDVKNQRQIEEAAILYIDVFSKALIELEKYLPKDLYSLIDARRKSASQMDREIKESELVNQCTNITIEEIDKLILLGNKKKFGRKNRVNSMMVG